MTENTQSPERFRVKWETMVGNVFRGEVIEVDNNVLIVKCDDGRTKAVEMINALPDDPRYLLDCEREDQEEDTDD